MEVCLDSGHNVLDHIMLDGDSAPLKRGTAPPPIFGPWLLWPNGWMDKDATCREVDLGQDNIVLDGDPVPERGTIPLFSAHVYCGQTVADLNYC